MNYIFFNEDGSIKKTNFTDSIQQNDDGSDKIFISIDGIDYSEYSAVGVFVLPDGTVSEEGADFESDYEYASGETADGFLITLTINETKLPGVVFLTLQIIEDSTNKVKYTYRVALTINESASLSSLTLITLAQYNALKSYIDSNYLKRTYTFYSDTLLSSIISAVGEEVPFIFKYSYDSRKYLVDYKMVGSSNIQRIKFISLQENKCYIKKNFSVSGVTLANLISSANELETADKAWVSDISKLYKHTIVISDQGDHKMVTIVVYSKSASPIDEVSDLLNAGVYVDIDEALSVPLTAYIEGDNAIAIYTQIEPNQDYTSGYELNGYYIIEGYLNPFQSITFEIYNIYDGIEEVGD